MKKLKMALCLVALIGAVSQGAFAYVKQEEMSTVPVIKSFGFSDSATKLTEYVRVMNADGKTQSYYDMDPYANDSFGKGTWYTAVKRWFDPAQEDNLFGRHEISFSNTWNDRGPAIFGKNKPVYPGAAKVKLNARDYGRDLRPDSLLHGPKPTGDPSSIIEEIQLENL